LAPQTLLFFSNHGPSSLDDFRLLPIFDLFIGRAQNPSFVLKKVTEAAFAAAGVFAPHHNPINTLNKESSVKKGKKGKSKGLESGRPIRP
jgi:hypothetical protein